MRGRPVRSQIRDNLAVLLSARGPKYGYALHKLHSAVFFPCTREVVYYHLRKGVNLGVFRVKNVLVEKGNFSWGGSAEKIVYEVVVPVTVSSKVKNALEKVV